MTLKNFQLDANDLASIEHIIPEPEPQLFACENGPRRGKIYPVAETKLEGNERRYLNECIDSNWISSQGPFVEKFERAFAPYAGCEYAIACTSGSTALHLILAALGLSSTDEVIIPTFTMIATANAVHYTGAKVKLIDAEPNYLNINADLIEAAITANTKAIIVVHTYGHPVEIRRIQAIARKHNLYLIEDAAEAHGAEAYGERVGGFGLGAAFSFYANKIITTGEGGMVTTNDGAFARLIKRLRCHAFSKERHFWHDYVGFNYRMTNMQAAIGLAQTERLDTILAARRQLRDLYVERLKDVKGIILPAENANMRNVFWMYAIRLTSALGCNRNEFRRRLAMRGIETRNFFIPIHLQPIYFNQFRGQSFPIAETLCQTGLYLPTSENYTESDIEWICNQIVDISRTCVEINEIF